MRLVDDTSLKPGYKRSSIGFVHRKGPPFHGCSCSERFLAMTLDRTRSSQIEHQEVFEFPLAYILLIIQIHKGSSLAPLHSIFEVETLTGTVEFLLANTMIKIPPNIRKAPIP